MKKKNSKLANIDWGVTIGIIFSWVLVILIGLLILLFIGLNIYALIAYGGKPIEEIPGWVWWLWNNSGNRR